MVKAELLEQDGILIVTPEDRLSEADFQSISAIADPYIEANGNLNGILIHAKAFPGWQNFGAIVSHFQFVKGHHKHVSKVAAVSDSRFLAIAPKIASHFVSAEVKHFPESDYDDALNWLKTEA
jgi:hypothetical protein